MHCMYLTIGQDSKDTDDRVNVWMNEQTDGLNRE